MTTSQEATPTFLCGVAQIAPDPENPRGEIPPDSLGELVSSIRTHGILQALIVRPVEGGVPPEDPVWYRLVCGHRRLAAAKLAGLETVPVQVVELTDQQVRELQLVENLQRADIHPIEEAEGFALLSRRFEMSAATIAERVGKSEGYVLRRMKLRTLPDIARKALRDGKLSLAAVQQLARIPNPKVAAEATKALLEVADQDGDGEITVKAAARTIRDEFMLELKQAAFPVADATLRPAAGACTECPKRTGNQKLLFADVADDDLCTDPACFREKMRAHGDRQLAQLKASGATILGKGEAKQLFADSYGDPGDTISPSSLRYNAPYVNPDDTADDVFEYRKRRRTLLRGKDLPPSVWAVDPRTGIARELWRKADWQKAVKAAGLVKTDGHVGAGALTAQEKASRKRMAEKAALEAAVADATIAAFVDAGGEGLFGPSVRPYMVVLARAAIERAWDDTIKRVVARRGLGLDKNGKRLKTQAAELLVARLDMAPEDGAGMLVEVLLAPMFTGAGYRITNKDLRLDAEQLFGIDTKAISAKVREEREAAKIVRVPAGAKRKGKAKAKPKRARSSQKGTCRACGCTENAACPEGCAWADDSHTICTSCAGGGE